MAGRRPVTDPRRDPRYGTRRWQRVRLAVLQRDRWQCQVAVGCPEPATIADHIEPVYLGMPDADFYSPTNLRGSCRRHNWARGVAARLEREAADAPGPAPVTAPAPILRRHRLSSVRWATVRR